MSAQNARQSTTARLAIWMIAGFIISVGMSFGGMAHESSLYFFDPLRTGRNALFDWSMLIVFSAGLIPTLLYVQFVKRGSAPWFDTHWNLPTNTVVDRRLVVGSILFGAGWALGGFCPGPPVAGMITGHPTFIAFSYGMYVQNVARSTFESGGGRRHWWLTIALGLVPAAFYFAGPTLFPLEGVSPALSWPLAYSILGGLGIALASILVIQFNGRVLGVCGLWRRVLDLNQTPGSRLPQALFFVAFMAGGVFTYFVAPESFASPPNADRSLVWVFVGGFVVAQGTGWSNGCTSGHGIAGMARLSVRSMVAVPTFMASVFVFLPVFNLLLGTP